MNGGKILILSDGKPGHLNQSLALAKLAGCEYEVLEVRFPHRLFKALSYPFDRLKLRSSRLFVHDPPQNSYAAVVSAGSETYYANKTLAGRLQIPSIAIMLPRGYRHDFDLIIAPAHDRPPRAENILPVPVNLCHPVPAGMIAAEPGKRYVSVVVGGSNREFTMEAAYLRHRFEEIFALFPQHGILVATSRRTPRKIEAMIDSLPFARKFLYSRDTANPIPDLLAISDYVFLTADSTSMISEAVCFGRACVEVIPLPNRRRSGKFQRFVDHLSDGGFLHVFDGNVGRCDAKVDLAAHLRRVRLCE